MPDRPTDHEEGLNRELLQEFVRETGVSESYIQATLDFETARRPVMTITLDQWAAESWNKIVEDWRSHNGAITRHWSDGPQTPQEQYEEAVREQQRQQPKKGSHLRVVK